MENTMVIMAINRDTGEYREFSGENHYIRSRKQDTAYFKKTTTWNNPFTWANMESIKQLLSGRKISDLTLGAIVALTAYINDDRTLLCNADKKPLNRKEIQRLLNLKDSTAKKMFKELLETGVIIENDRQLRYNEMYNYVGSIKNRKDLKNMVRMQKKGIQALLNSGLDLKDMALIYKVIPYVDAESCAICNNPNGQDQEDRRSMTSDELATAMGIDVSHLKRKLSRLTFTYKANSVNVLGYTGTGYKDRTCVVNPAIIRRNNFYDDVNFSKDHILFEVFSSLASDDRSSVKNEQCG